MTKVFVVYGEVIGDEDMNGEKCIIYAVTSNYNEAEKQEISAIESYNEMSDLNYKWYIQEEELIDD